jgi:tRNA wybutosine-synthesizing protein 3
MNEHYDRYLKQRNHALEKYHKAKQQGAIDSEVEGILEKLNALPMYYTTSSCAGRIVVMEIPKIGDKKHAKFHGKWHRCISVEELEQAINLYEKHQLWLLAQPPIFHIGCKSLKDADAMVHLGVSSGLKHSGIRTLKDQIIVELCSTERMDIPLNYLGEFIINQRFLDILVSITNDVICRAQKKMKKFEKELLDFTP